MAGSDINRLTGRSIASEQRRGTASIDFKKPQERKDWGDMDDSIKDYIAKLDYQLQKEYKGLGYSTEVTSGIRDKAIKYLSDINEKKRHLYGKGSVYYEDGVKKFVRVDKDYAHRSGYGADIVFRNKDGSKLNWEQTQALVSKVTDAIKKSDPKKYGNYKFEVEGEGKPSKMHAHLKTVGNISKQEAVDYAELLRAGESGKKVATPTPKKRGFGQGGDAGAIY